MYKRIDQNIYVGKYIQYDPRVWDADWKRWCMLELHYVCVKVKANQ